MALQIVARVANLAVGVVVTALVARALGEAGFGQWSTLLVVVQLASYFTTFGLETVVVREAAADPSREQEWIGVLLILRAALVIPAMLVGLAAILAVHVSTAMLVAGVLLLLEMPINIGSSLRVVHQLRVRNTVPMIVLTLNSVVWGGVVLAVFLAEAGIVALAAGFTASAAISAAVQVVTALHLVRPSLRPSRDAIVKVARVGIPIGLAGLLIMAYARIDQLLVFSIAGSDEAGLYGAAYRIIDQAQFIPVSLMTTLVPILAANWTLDRERMLRVVRLGAEFLAIGSLGGLAVTIAAAEHLTVILYGSEFKEAGPALPVLTAAFVFICFGYLTTNLLIVIGAQRRLITVGVIGFIVNVAGNLIAIPIWGFMGAAWMTLLTELVVVSATAGMLRRRLDLGWDALGRVPRVLAAAVVLGVALAGVQAADLSIDWLFLVTAVVYPAALIAFRAVDIGEVRQLLRERGKPVAEGSGDDGPAQ